MFHKIKSYLRWKVLGIVVGDTLFSLENDFEIEVMVHNGWAVVKKIEGGTVCGFVGKKDALWLTNKIGEVCFTSV